MMPTLHPGRSPACCGPPVRVPTCRFLPCWRLAAVSNKDNSRQVQVDILPMPAAAPLSRPRSPTCQITEVTMSYWSAFPFWLFKLGLSGTCPTTIYLFHYLLSRNQITEDNLQRVGQATRSVLRHGRLSNRRGQHLS